MSFKDHISDLAERANTAMSVAQTEEATKNAVIMPFIRALGFDVFDPTQSCRSSSLMLALRRVRK